MHPALATSLEASGLVSDDEAVCVYCGCFREECCQLPGQPYRCSWYRIVGDFAVCSNPECVKAYLADLEAP